MLRRFLRDTRGDMAEAAVTLPAVLLVTLMLINMTIAGFASVNANNAANYGARVGSVTQEGAAAAAVAAARQALSVAAVGDYEVSASGGGPPGSTVVVRVTWSVPNYLVGLTSLFGVSTPDEFSGTATATFRQEGW